MLWCWVTQAAGAQLDEATSRGLSKAQAWNSAGAALFKASRVHCVYNIASIFVDAVNDAAAAEAADADTASHRLAATLKTVCDLYILHYLSEVRGTLCGRTRAPQAPESDRCPRLCLFAQNMTPLLVRGFISPEQARMIEAEVRHGMTLVVIARALTARNAYALLVLQTNAAIGSVRQIAVPLVDAFNLSDFIVNSPLGRYVCRRASFLSAKRRACVIPRSLLFCAGALAFAWTSL